MNETEKIARDICEFSGIFLTCEECCKTTGRICECIRYAARIWNKGYRGVRIGLQTKTAYCPNCGAKMDGEKEK